jgi:xanthine dehydrogenase large subunit
MSGAVGKPVPHESAREHVTGKALYTDDLGVRLANLLHAYPVQAPHAHATVLNLETAPALEVPGVVHVLSAKDVRGENDTGPGRRDEPLFPSEVMFHGMWVAWVLADSEEAARLGAARVVATYEPLPAVVTLEDAIAQGSFHTEPAGIARGDAEAALNTAPKRLKGELYAGGQEHFYLETNAALAYTDESGQLLVQSSTQHPTETQEIVARVCELEKHAVTVQCLRMGGGFGGKETQANVWAAVAALGALVTNRPVRVRLNRTLDMTFTGKRHPFLGRFEVGFDETGKLHALSLELFSDGGWSLDLSDPVLWRAMFHSDNAYFIPNVRVTGTVCKTHKTSQTAFRGFGGPQGMLMIEEIMTRVAHALGLPPEVVRERNFYGVDPSVLEPSTHYGQVVEDAERIHRIWHELKQSSSFEERRAEIEAFNSSHAHLKRGLAITPVKFGISFTATFYNQAGALVLIYKDGSVLVNHGGTEMGQGLHTKILQIAAQTLGVPLETVRIAPTRTDKVPNTSATAASSGSDLNGAAVRDACETLRARLSSVAAQRFGVGAGDIVFEDGRVYPLGAPELAVEWRGIVHTAYMQRVQLFSDGFYRTPGIHWDKAKGQGKPFYYFAYGAAVSEVEVNRYTGEHHMRRVDILHDVGNSLSPLIDLGQIEGGFAQGAGWLTLEELVWNVDGRLVTNGASTYKLPSLHELPPVFNVNLLERAAQPSVVYGSKAVGEPPFMLAISVREALKDAIRAFNPRGGAVNLASPATPEAVFWALEAMLEPEKV